MKLATFLLLAAMGMSGQTANPHDIPKEEIDEINKCLDRAHKRPLTLAEGGIIAEWCIEQLDPELVKMEVGPRIDASQLPEGYMMPDGQTAKPKSPLCEWHTECPPRIEPMSCVGFTGSWCDETYAINGDACATIDHALQQVQHGMVEIGGRGYCRCSGIPWSWDRDLWVNYRPPDCMKLPEPKRLRSTNVGCHRMQQ